MRWINLIALATLSTAGCATMHHKTSAGCARPSQGPISVRSCGAIGDGKAIETPAINSAIDRIAAAGGGVVYFPAGTYKSFSIHLKSNVTLYLDNGATILAAKSFEGGQYDSPEPFDGEQYEDFGHAHWHNSLIWGEDLTNIAILGPGTIDGEGLTRGIPIGHRSQTNPNPPTTSKMPTPPPSTLPKPWFDGRDVLGDGIGNKSISLKNCRNVIFRDFKIYRGGHFGILATGVDNFTIDNLKIDTNRDGMDIDCCYNVRVSNCTVNSPFDDGICLKSSYSLNRNRPCENITITNCQVSGYVCGSLLDGTYRRSIGENPHPTGRIKFGTESNGGFKNITISNCVFEYCQGLALESEDGAILEDVTIDNITMRDITSAPLFLRLGARMRTAAGNEVGVLRRVIISNIVSYNSDPRFCSIISGIPGHDIEDVRLSNIKIYERGGGDPSWATTQPAENVEKYPDPGMFGPMPAYGFFIRHINGLDMRGVEVHHINDDNRSPFVINDAKNIDLRDIRAQRTGDVQNFQLHNVENFRVSDSGPEIKDVTKEKVDAEKF